MSVRRCRTTHNALTHSPIAFKHNFGLVTGNRVYRETDPCCARLDYRLNAYPYGRRVCHGQTFLGNSRYGARIKCAGPYANDFIENFLFAFHVQEGIIHSRMALRPCRPDSYRDLLGFTFLA